MALWSSDQLAGPSYLQFLPPQNIEHSLASVTDRRSASERALYFAVATVAAINKQYIKNIFVLISYAVQSLEQMTLCLILLTNPGEKYK